MSLRWMDLFIILVIAVSSSVLTFKIMAQYAEPKIAIVDMLELAQGIDPKANNRKELVKEVVKKTKLKAQSLWDEGYIVMKADEFLEAPEYLYVEIE